MKLYRHCYPYFYNLTTNNEYIKNIIDINIPTTRFVESICFPVNKGVITPTANQETPILLKKSESLSFCFEVNFIIYNKTIVYSFTSVVY